MPLEQKYLMLTSPPPPSLGMAANTGVLIDVTSQTIQQNATAHTTGCRHHTACRNRLNTQQITEAAKQPNLPSNQHTIQPTPPTTPHENTAHHRARHVTTTHYPPRQYSTPRHCTVQHTITRRSIALLLMSKSPGILNGKCLGTCSDTPKAIPNMLGDLLSGHQKNPKRFPERPPDKSQAISRAGPG